MTDFFYTCNHCGKVLIDDRYHLAGSKDYDICHYDYNQLSMENKALFVYTQNEHMGGPSGSSGGSNFQCDASTTPLSLLVAPTVSTIPDIPDIPSAPASLEEDYQQALLGIDSDDERSEDSMSTGSLTDFLDDNTLPMEEERVNGYEIVEFEEFFAGVPDTEQAGQTMPMTPNICVTRMEGEYGESESDWSETDEDEDEVEHALRETPSDRAEARMAESNPEIIRVPNRPFGKRVIKPRLGNLFTYPAKWIKNGGEGEF